MKPYPSIFKLPCEFTAHVFDKLDGSNLRFEWSKKRGWYKYGTRKRMFDESDEVFGEAIPLFHQTLASPIADIAKKEQWQKVVVFAEFWGKESFAGLHVKDDPKRLTLFDVSPHQQGFLPPVKFRKLFEGVVDTPLYLGKYNWNKNFVDRIREEGLEGITLEGVIGKGIVKNNLVMAKAKTQVWLDKVKDLYKDDADSIINS